MEQRIAVIGTTGFLGRTYLEGNLRPLGIDRKTLDLTKAFEEPLIKVLNDHPVSAALICSAISSPDECKTQPELSEQVNVKGTLRLLKVLKDLGIKPVFFSTDHVYDGQKGFYREDDTYSPVTLYGRQKVAAETFLRENFSDYLILRTSKQVSTRLDKKNILAEMGLKLLNGQSIRCATDHSISPIFVEDIVDISLEALKRGISGPLHLAAPKIYTRLELGYRIADLLNVERSLVIPCSINDFSFIEVRPPQCTLDSGRLFELLNPKLTSLEDGVSRLHQRILSSGKMIELNR